MRHQFMCHKLATLVATVRVNEMDTRFQKQFPLLCFFAVTNVALKEANAAPEDL